MKVWGIDFGAIDWPTWVQAISPFLGILVAIWVARKSTNEARRLVEDERRRQASIAIDMFVRRLEDVSKEATRKRLWLEQRGAPEVFAQQAPWEVHHKEGRRLQLVAGDALLNEARPALYFLTGVTAIQAGMVIDLIASYNIRIESEIAAHTHQPNLGPFFRQSLGSLAIHELRSIEWAAESAAKFLEKDWRLPGSPAPDKHQRPTWWRRAFESLRGKRPPDASSAADPRSL